MGKSRKCDLIGSTIAIVVLLLSSLLPSSFFSLDPLYQEAVASSSAFELQEITNENRQWVQTYGNNDDNLKSNYTDVLAVNYMSDGKNLNVTMWLASGFENNSTSPPAYNQPFRKISYGMLIDADSNTKTGYNGADYDFYVEVAEGKLSGYLYQLSSTGGYRLVGSKINLQYSFHPDDLQNSVTLSLDLGSINYPNRYDFVVLYSRVLQI